MHEAGSRRGLRHQRVVDRVALEGAPPLLRFRLIAHAGPNVGIHHVGVDYRVRRAHQRMDGWPDAIVQAGAALAGGIEGGFLQLVPVGSGNGHVDTHRRGAQTQAAGNIVAVADIGQVEAVGATVGFCDGKQVGHGLTGVFPVGEGVDHWHGAVLHQSFQRGVGVDPRDNAIDVSAEHPRHIGDGFALPEANLILPQVHAVPAQLGNANLEADAGAKGRFFKQQRNALAGQWLHTPQEVLPSSRWHAESTHGFPRA